MIYKKKMKEEKYNQQKKKNALKINNVAIKLY